MRYAPLILLVTLTACDVTPRQRWGAAREGLTTSTKALAFLAEQKMLTDKEVVEVDKVVKSARAALDEAEKQLPDGGTSFEGFLSVVRAVLVRLAEIEAESKQRIEEGPPPAEPKPMTLLQEQRQWTPLASSRSPSFLSTVQSG